MRVELCQVAMSCAKVMDRVTVVVEQSSLAWHDFNHYVRRTIVCECADYPGSLSFLLYEL